MVMQRFAKCKKRQKMNKVKKVQKSVYLTVKIVQKPVRRKVVKFVRPKLSPSSARSTPKRKGHACKKSVKAKRKVKKVKAMCKRVCDLMSHLADQTKQLKYLKKSLLLGAFKTCKRYQKGDFRAKILQTKTYMGI